MHSFQNLVIFVMMSPKLYSKQMYIVLHQNGYIYKCMYEVHNLYTRYIYTVLYCIQYLHKTYVYSVDVHFSIYMYCKYVCLYVHIVLYVQQRVQIYVIIILYIFPIS